MTEAEPRDILLMAHGAATTVDELPAYYTHVRGTPPPAALLEELAQRYRAIGGGSPLNAITQKLARSVQAELDRRHGPSRLRVRFAFKHRPPFVSDVVGEIVDGGSRELLGLALAPHYSRFAIGGYRHAVETALAAAPDAPRFEMVSSWHTEPSFVRAWAQRLAAALGSLPEAVRPRSRVLFTAHSLPEKLAQGGDPYVLQLAEGAIAIARGAGIDEGSFDLAWQSAGRTSDRWLGPDLGEVLREEPARGTTAVVVVPHGFVCDHLEVLYDIDLEASAKAEALGLRLVRARMPNADPDFVAVVADVVDRALWGAPGGGPREA